MKSEDLRAGRGLLSDPSVARDPSVGLGLRLDETGRVPSAALLGSGYAGAGTKFLADNGKFQAVPGPTTYRKITAKTVNTSVAATDLLNGEITVAANAMGSTGMLRLTAIGDMLNNSGGAVAPPRFQLLFGGTTIFDTGALGADFANAATRWGWRIQVELLNTASNAQACYFHLEGALNAAASNGVAFISGEGKYVVVGGSAATVMLADGYNSAAVDTTASQALVLNAINGSASASYETKLTSALVEII